MAHRFDLTPLNLTPGALVTLYADARDRDDLRGPKTGKSREIRLRVVTPEEIARQLEAEQREIRELLARIADMQDRALTPVEEASRTLEQAQSLDEAARDELSNASVIQRQVTDRVTSKADGLAEKIDRFLQNLENLKIENPDVQNQMREMREGVSRIEENHLGPAEQNLTRALKGLDAIPRPERAAAGAPDQKRPEAGEAAPDRPQDEAAKPEPATTPAGADRPAEDGESKPRQAEADSNADAESKGQPAGGPPEGKETPPAPKNGPPSEAVEQTKAELAQAGENQKAIADELRRMLDNMKEFETYRGAVQDAKKILQDQQEAMKSAAEMAAQPDLTGKSPEQLDGQQRSRLENLGARQDEIARSLQDLESKMDEMANRIEEADPNAAAALREASEQSRRQGTSAKMSQSGQQMKDNQMGSARANQEKARDELKELVDTLENRREAELAQILKELKATQQAIQDIQQQQKDLKADTAKAGENPDDQQRKEELQRLAKRQQQLQEQLKKELQKLKKNRATAANRSGQQAAGSMANAQQGMEGDEGEEAEQDQDEALADLQNTIQDIDEEIERVEEQLAMEQFARMKDGLKALAERQEKLATDTDDYDQKREEAGELTPAQQAGVRALARIETALRQETDDLTSRLKDAPVFALTLKKAGEQMSLATRLLQRVQTDTETQEAEKSAARRFRQLLEAMEPEKAQGGSARRRRWWRRRWRRRRWR